MYTVYSVAALKALHLNSLWSWRSKMDTPLLINSPKHKLRSDQRFSYLLCYTLRSHGSQFYYTHRFWWFSIEEIYHIVLVAIAIKKGEFYSFGCHTLQLQYTVDLCRPSAKSRRNVGAVFVNYFLWPLISNPIILIHLYPPLIRLPPFFRGIIC